MPKQQWWNALKTSIVRGMFRNGLVRFGSEEEDGKVGREIERLIVLVTSNGSQMVKSRWVDIRCSGLPNAKKLVMRVLV